jgi:hypothetical protein
MNERVPTNAVEKTVLVGLASCRLAVNVDHLCGVVDADIVVSVGNESANGGRAAGLLGHTNNLHGDLTGGRCAGLRGTFAQQIITWPSSQPVAEASLVCVIE